MLKEEAVQLFQELRDSLTTIEQWIDPPLVLLEKLTLWEHTARQIVNTNSPAKGREDPNFEWDATDEEVKEVNDEESLRLIYSTHRDLELARTMPEKLAVVLYYLAILEKHKIWNAGEEGYGENYEKLVSYYHKKIESIKSGLSSADSTDELKRVVETFIPSKFSSPKTNSKIAPSTVQPNFEQTKVLNRVAMLLENEKYWVGTLSEFVYAMDFLAIHGYLKANELEEALAESFQHKRQGKDKPEKLTPEQIKKRRSNMANPNEEHTASEEIKRTMNKMIETMPKKKKS